ncbi:restriction endonuclease subunit S [Candidatus Dependentiae bacterium]|nr:restriction endonuclease subunit S [Candidatus Dependentiae bacterium]
MDSLQRCFDIALETPDGIKKLRGLILSLAMKGKLAPQNKNDQPAKELLKEIEAEKSRLLKEGKIKKQEPLPQIKNEEIPYELPENWVWVRLGEISALITKGSSPNWQGINYTDSSNGILFITSENVDNFKLKFNNKKYVEYKFNEIEPRSILQKFDILMNIVGASIGRVAYYDLDEIANINQAVCLIRLIYIGKYTDLNYLLYFLNSSICLSYMFSKQVDNARANLSMANIAKFLIPFPSFTEQKRIVSKIDQLMALCDTLEKQKNERNQKQLAVHTSALNRLLNSKQPNEFNKSWQFITKQFSKLYSISENILELKKAILQIAMQGKLVPQNPNDPPASELLKEIESEKKRLIKEGKIKEPKPLPPIKPNEIPYELPKGWEWVRLNDALDVRDGTHDTPKYVQVGYPLITSKNLYTGKLSFDDIKFISKEDHLKTIERSKVEKGDILFAMIGSIGNPVIVNTNDEFSIKNIALFKYYRDNTPNTKFVYYYFFYTQKKMKAISSGAVQSFVSLGFLRNYLFPLPPLPEQKRIVTKIERLMTLCDTLDKQIKSSEEKKIKIFDAVLAQIQNK